MHAQPAQTRPLPRAQQDALRQAERLCWWTLLWMSLVSALMYAAMGGSQAMKTALIEDVLSLVPSIAFLVASRFRRKGADHEYLIGRERAFDINVLISAVALTGVVRVLQNGDWAMIAPMQMRYLDWLHLALAMGLLAFALTAGRKAAVVVEK